MEHVQCIKTVLQFSMTSFHTVKTSEM